MKFIEFYLKNKHLFPELEFFEVKYSGDNNGYNIGYNDKGQMKYLERDMIIMIPKACSQLLKENLKNIDNIKTYAYFNDLFFNTMSRYEKNKYEKAFMTSDNKILIPLSEFVYDKLYNIVTLKNYKETETLLNLINSFLTISGLDSKYCSIQSTYPECSFTWCIKYCYFNNIKKIHISKNK